MLAIEIKNLKKNYGKTEALRDITLNVPVGGIYGLLGANGAGKTTTIKALVGTLRPSSGSVKTLGLDPLKKKKTVMRQIGYMPQTSALYEDLSARENIIFFGQLQNTSHLNDKVKHLLEFTELTNRADDPVHMLSGGMKKRVSLACALIHQPKLLLLDEPTAAVDVPLRAKIWQLFRELTTEGITIFVSTHLMDEALLCDHLAIMRKGELLTVDTPEKIMEKGKTHLKITTNTSVVEKIVAGHPQDLADALKEFGLSSAIKSIAIKRDSLDTIIFDLIKKDR